MENEWYKYADYPPPRMEVDIKLLDGSILCDAWWQSDRDFYWKCKPNGEMFICEFSVTHWRHSQSL